MCGIVNCVCIFEPEPCNFKQDSSEKKNILYKYVFFLNTELEDIDILHSCWYGLPWPWSCADISLEKTPLRCVRHLSNTIARKSLT